MLNSFLCLFFFFVSISAPDRVPDQSLITDGQGEKGESITAFKDGHNKYAVVYLQWARKLQLTQPPSMRRGSKHPAVLIVERNQLFSL
jgi:hypothetical protein